MTDIDFDELDKAVNSALKPKLDKTVNVTTTIPEPSEPVLPKAPAVQTEVVVEAAQNEAIIKPAPRQSLISPASRRSGRFMDMVHPSSNMATDKELKPAPKLKLVPTDPTLTADTSKDDTVNIEVSKPTERIDADLPKSEPIEPKAEPKPDMNTPELGASQYPDPLDVIDVPHETGETEKTDAPAAVETDAAPMPAPSPVEPAGETPFIADAKVEKRPLGGFAAEESENAIASGMVSADHLTTGSQLPPESVLPEALQSDVVAVESDTAVEEPVGEFNPDDLKPSSPVSETAAQPQSHQPAIAQSIPQQYHSAPVQADDTLRPVFDTQEYHQPLIPEHAAKKNHTWVFALLVLVLLILGGALGYFAFVSGL